MDVKAFLERITGKVVGIDTMNFIYAFEENPTYIKIVKSIFAKIEKGEIKGITNSITVTECLVRPFELGDISLLAKYKLVFRNFPNLSVYSIDMETTVKAAELRASHHIKTPDALQLATCLINNASVFITNDLPLSRVANMTIVQLNNFISNK